MTPRPTLRAFLFHLALLIRVAPASSFSPASPSTCSPPPRRHWPHSSAPPTWSVVLASIPDRNLTFAVSCPFPSSSPSNRTLATTLARECVDAYDRDFLTCRRTGDPEACLDGVARALVAKAEAAPDEMGLAGSVSPLQLAMGAMTRTASRRVIQLGMGGRLPLAYVLPYSKKIAAADPAPNADHAPADPAPTQANADHAPVDPAPTQANADHAPVDPVPTQANADHAPADPGPTPANTHLAAQLRSPSSTICISLAATARDAFLRPANSGPEDVGELEMALKLL